MTTLVLGGILVEIAVYVAIRDVLRPAGFAVPAAAYAVASFAVLWVFSAYTNLWAAYRSRLGWHLVVGCLCGSALGILLLGFARADWHLPGSTAAALAVGGTVLGALYCVRLTRRGSLLSMARMVRGKIPRQAAQETYEACQRLRRGRRLPAEARKIVMLNLAKAAIARSISGDAPDGLAEAADVLRELIQDPPADWLAMMHAAAELVDASYVKSDKHGDFLDYEDALRLLADTAERVASDFGAIAIVHQKHAEHQLELALRLPRGPGVRRASGHGGGFVASGDQHHLTPSARPPAGLAR
jgi:hypothetical protein